MVTISRVHGTEILDSRGNPTVSVTVELSSGVTGKAAVPSGASTGQQEALELRDGDMQRYGGQGVLKAVAHINGEIQEALVNKNPMLQEEIDCTLIELDGSNNKQRLGANAVLGASLAVLRAAANEARLPLYQYLGGEGPFFLPVPQINIINGGAHANNSLEVQEFMILPTGAPTFREALRYGSEIFHTLQKRLAHHGWSTAVGDEGGFAPNLPNAETALELILQAIEEAGYTPGKHITLALDVASSEFHSEAGYHLESEDKYYTSDAWIDRLASWVDRYPIVSIEDGLAEGDWPGWLTLTEQLSDRVQLVGDDLFATNPKLLQKGIDHNIATAILVKLNQIATVTETLATIGLAKQAHYEVIISHRSGETEDTSIADLAVATRARQIKTGSLCRSDRVAKYNRLLEIEAELGDDAVYFGQSGVATLVK